jgi:hypothetical protein
METSQGTERNRAGTHQLSRAEGGTGQEIEGNRVGEALTLCRGQREGQVRIWKETERATRRGTHFLSSAKGGDKSGHRKNSGRLRTLTNCQAQREVYIRRLKETERERDTHFLLSAGRDKSAYRKELIVQGILTLCRAKRDKLKQQKKSSRRGALTTCRAHGSKRSGHQKTEQERRTHGQLSAEG